MHFSSAQSKPFGDYRFIVCFSGFSLLIPALLTGHQADFQYIAVSFLSAIIFLKACIPTHPAKSCIRKACPNFFRGLFLRRKAVAFCLWLLLLAVGCWLLAFTICSSPHQRFNNSTNKRFNESTNQRTNYELLVERTKLLNLETQTLNPEQHSP
jgi:hypothetical protein